MKNFLIKFSLLFLLFNLSSAQDVQLPGVAGENTGSVNVQVNLPPGGGEYGTFGTGSVLNGGGAFGGFGGAGGPGVGFGLPGGPLPNGQAAGIPGAYQSASSEGCPFNAQSDDVRAIWDSTKQILQNINNEQQSGQCGLVQANSASLREALTRLEGQTFRQIGTSSSALDNTFAQLSGQLTPDCQNFESLYMNEYEQMISLVAGNYEMGSMPIDYNRACVQFYPTDPNNFQYSQEFVSCLGDVLAQKLQTADTTCGTQSGYLDDIEDRRAQYRATQEAILGIQGAMTQLATNIQSCDNDDIRQSALRSILNVGSIIASPLTGGTAGAAIAFGGPILDGILGVLFSGQSRSDLVAMEREEDYAQMACLFYNAQRLRCGPSSTFYGGGLGFNFGGSGATSVTGFGANFDPCDGQRPLSTLERETSDWITQLSNIVGTRDTVTPLDLIRLFGAPDTINGKSVIELLNTEIKPSLLQAEDYERVGELNEFLRRYEEMDTLSNSFYSGEADPFAEVPSLNDPNTMVRGSERLRQLVSRVVNDSNIRSFLGEYVASETTGAGFWTSMKYSESVQAFQQQMLSIQNETLSRWQNTRALDSSITAMVNNLKDDFEDRLRDHFLADLRSSIAYSSGDSGSMTEIDSRTRAFDQLSGIINDCMYTEAMHVMQESDLRTGARSTTQLQESQVFNRYCSNFTCGPKGFRMNRQDRFNPEAFRMEQCSTFYAADAYIDAMRQEYIGSGTVCGKSLEEILHEGESRRRR